MTINATIRVTLGGWFRLQVLRRDRSVRYDTGWFPNLITNGGLDRVGQGTCADYCSVGTSNTAPANTDTALLGYVPGATVAAKGGTSVTSVSGSAPYYGYGRVQFEFAVGQAAGNLNEVGVGWANGNSSLFSRSLISPTVTVLSDEILVVTYELRIYAPTSDVTGTVSIGGVNRDFVMRAAEVNDASFTGWASFGRGGSGGCILTRSGGVIWAHAYPSTSVLGAVTGSPSGANSRFTGDSNAAYTPGNYYRDGTITAGLSDCNVSGGIACARVSHSLGCYQLSFSPVLAKDNTKTLSLTFRFSWARH